MNDIIILQNATEAEELVVNGEAMLVSNGTCSVESANMGIPMESGKDPFKRSLIVIITVIYHPAEFAFFMGCNGSVYGFVATT